MLGIVKKELQDVIVHVSALLHGGSQQNAPGTACGWFEGQTGSGQYSTVFPQLRCSDPKTVTMPRQMQMEPGAKGVYTRGQWEGKRVVVVESCLHLVG